MAVTDTQEAYNGVLSDAQTKHEDRSLQVISQYSNKDMRVETVNETV